MDALLFAVILEVALLQMKILETSASRRELNASKAADQAREKLARDRKLVTDIFKGTLVQLAENGEWYSLKQSVDSFNNDKLHLELIKARNDQLKRSLKDVSGELQNQDRNYTMEDGAYNANVQLKYADKLLNAQMESLKMKLEVTPAVVPSVQHEHCVHSELQRAFELQIKEKEDLLEYWQKKYIEDIADISERLKEQKEKYQSTATRRKELEDLYALHQGEMRGWLNFKRERAARLAREEHARQAATRIQAWWRGVMVRRCFGAFRYLRNSKKGTPKPKKK
ncbi:dynein regulatory complex protein 9-like [Aricia agestis]|uniref:dynein regulatory complex protein 9-like n=1 Tax=Aricia agestis TaxID=91739 RepID=UPI001C20244D|nr:dynein regulatory complex protein 9-like [Aricia agestis]